ncbi:MAG: DUF5119 domain-containing protein [Bacteroidales bacterium]
MKSIFTILTLIGIVLVCSCQRDDLYYATGNCATIRIEANWAPAQLTPNGASAYVFDCQGNAFGSVIQSNDPRKIDILLPEGCYDVIVLNNSTAEYKNIECVGINRIETFALIAKRIVSKYATMSNKAEIFVVGPDTVAGAVVRKIEVSKQMIDYLRYKPDKIEMTPAVVFQTTPTRMISVADITVHVKGLKYAAGAPRTHLKNFSDGYYPHSGKTSPLCVCHEFVLNNRTFDEGSTRDGTITKQQVTFGLHEQEGTRYLLNMEFVLLNGQKYYVALDVTDGIRVTEGVHKTIHIYAEIELPEVIGGGGGAFNPDLEKWNDVNVEIPM